MKEKEKIQRWVDNRFGVPNSFNTQLLIDFLAWVRKGLQTLSQAPQSKSRGMEDKS